MKINSKLTPQNCIELATIFKEKSDGVAIFPKLPSMLKLYLKQWESNSLIKLALNAMKQKHDTLLRLFSSQKVSITSNFDAKCRMKSNYCKLPKSAESDHMVSPGCVYQNSYIHSKNKNSTSRARRCTNYPLCTDCASVCNGYRPHL